MKDYENIFLEKYKILNKEQKRAVDTIDGPVFVMAGPGTGKTQILTLRIANILRKVDGIEPENILALTFTNAAAYNMRERLSKIIGGELAYRVTISTFHSFAEEMMKRYSEYFPKFIDSRLLSPVEQIEFIEEILEDMKNLIFFSKFRRRENTLSSISFNIGKIKDEGLSPDEYREKTNERYEEDLKSPDLLYKRDYGEYKKGDIKRTELIKLDRKRDKSLELADIYELYQDKLNSKKRYDFSDLMLDFVQELRSDSDFQTEIQEQFHYILIDEHQDTNDVQNDIIFSLINNTVWEGKPNIFVVGDSKQAIFRFAGASKKSYSSLISFLSDVKIIELSDNYRSNQKILDSSHSLITKSQHHKDEKLLKAFFNDGGVLEYRRFKNDINELLFVAQNVRDSLKKGKKVSEIAILFRNNKDVEELRKLLSIYNIPFQDFSKKNILKDRDIMKLFFVIRSIYDLTDDEVVAKSLFIDFLNFNVFDVQKIINGAKFAKKQENKSIFSIINNESRMKDLGINDVEIKKFIEYSNFLLQAKSFSENEDFITFFSWFIRESGILKYFLSQKDSQYGITKLEKLFNEIRRESYMRNEFSLGDFIDYLNTLKKHNITMNVVDINSEGVQLMTFHGSKGLEFETVYIIKALNKSKISKDISLPFDDFSDGDIDDERRLIYVAITRAKHECYISSYITNSEGKEKTQSLFIDEIDGLDYIDVSEWEKDHNRDIVDIFGEDSSHIKSLLDKDYIQKIFNKKQLSVSALNNYIESPLKYFFRNLVALPEVRSHFLDFGNLIHETLEEYFNLCKIENKILSINILKNSFNKVLSRKYFYEEFSDRAWDVLESYYKKNKKDFVIPLENELRINGISFVVDDGEHIILSGAIDKITKNDDGSIIVWDYKTGKAYSDMDKKRRNKIKRQAVFYKMLLQGAYGGKYNFRFATFDFVEKNSKNEYEHKTFEITQNDIENLKKEIMELVDDIKNGTLLDKDFSKDSTNKELLEFLEVMRGPRTHEQNSLFSDK